MPFPTSTCQRGKAQYLDIGQDFIKEIETGCKPDMIVRISFMRMMWSGGDNWEAEERLIKGTFGSEEAFQNALNEEDPGALEFRRCVRLAIDSRTRIEIGDLIEKVNGALEELDDYDGTDYFSPGLVDAFGKLTGQLKDWKNDSLYDLCKDAISFLTKQIDAEDEGDEAKREKIEKVTEARLKSFVAGIQEEISWTEAKSKQFAEPEEEEGEQERGESGEREAEPEAEADELAPARNALPAPPPNGSEGLGKRLRQLIGRD